MLKRLSWPGNVLQLKWVIRQLALEAPQTDISAAEVEAALGTLHWSAMTANMLKTQFSLTRSQTIWLAISVIFGDVLPPLGVHRRVIREVERPLLEIALEATGGNQIQCAELLGVNRNTLRKKLRDLEIPVRPQEETHMTEKRMSAWPSAFRDWLENLIAVSPEEPQASAELDACRHRRRRTPDHLSERPLFQQS